MSNFKSTAVKELVNALMHSIDNTASGYVETLEGSTQVRRTLELALSGFYDNILWEIEDRIEKVTRDLK